MATSQEAAFAAAVVTANGVRQGAYAAAFATYAPNGFPVFANLAAYRAALISADNTFQSAVQSAATTSGVVDGSVVGSLLPGQMYNVSANIIS